MAKSKTNWNIAFEISPLLTASGSFGDKSGVFRYMYGFLINLIKELKSRDANVKIILFTFAPHNLKYAVCPELLELIEDKNVTLLGYKKDLDATVPHHNRLFDVIEIRPIKKMLKILDNLFSLRDAYSAFVSKRGFKAYVRSLEREFAQQGIPTIFHSETGFFELSGFTNVVTMYDLTTLLFPELHRKATVDLHLRKIRFAKNDAQVVLAISESTRKDLLSYSDDFNQKPVVIAYPGLDRNFIDSTLQNKLEFKKVKELAEGVHQSIDSKRYLLYYGTFEPRKNITFAVRAFTELYNAGEIPSDYRFVLIGGKGWGKTKENIVAYVAENFPILTERPIIVLDYATDMHLKAYIKHARAVLYPSLYEGFGLPVLESMALGTPVITSNTSSLPEVGGDAAMYINPKDFFGIKANIKTIIEDDELVTGMSKRGIIQSKKFTWKKTINSVLQALESNTPKSNG